MDIKAELEANRQKQKELALELNGIEGQRQELNDRKQELLQELLRLDGEMRLLKRLEEGKKNE